MDNENSNLEGVTGAELAVDYWKLLKVCERLMVGLPEDRRKRVEAQLRFSASRLDTHLKALSVELHTFEGMPFGPELPAVAINADEFDSAENLLVESAIEPAVIIHDRVFQNARVMLKGSDTYVFGN